MKVLIFDVECANCFGGDGKICEFGYMLCDENFSVLEKDNIIINPDTQFDKKGFAINKISLSLPYEEYYKREKFPARYKRIKNLFAGEDFVAVGHGTHFDAKYLLYECNRYGLKPFDFRFIDTQEVVQKYYQRTTRLRLIDIYCDFFPEKAHKQQHIGLDDAEMTAEILRFVLRDKNITLSEILLDDSLVSYVFEGQIVSGNVFRITPSEVMGKKNRKLFELCVEENSKKCKGESFAFPSEYEHKHFPQMVRLLQLMTQNNLRYSISTKRAYYVTMENNEWKLRHVRKEKVIPFSTFLSKIGYTEEKFSQENIDVEGIVSQLEAVAPWYERFKKYKQSFSLK